jgi:hypothetical protein
LQPKAGFDATFPDGALNWNKPLNAAGLLMGTRRRRRSKLVERVSRLEALENPPKVSITILESPGSVNVVERYQTHQAGDGRTSHRTRQVVRSTLRARTPAAKGPLLSQATHERTNRPRRRSA